ncbi:MAG: UDP-glucose/GDP-mannose dehydrogenase family protein [Deltaproteobacteria bacterium]|nr:UDP-glucose/GDP-mannose dehydrogenase family protein [Deltaproteobacteria bacterium]MBW2339902.1 UDP-glucose/GDP-mannose dehydrogenase family protein [Deltaproteobacteria bacterium]
MHITMIGTGYVGLVSGAGLADFGMQVICVDKNVDRIQGLNRGEIPFYEPGLEEFVERNVKNGRLSFTTDLKMAVENSLVIFVAVGTPDDGQGKTDLSQVEDVAKRLAQAIDEYKVIVMKSTVPVGTNRWLKEMIQANLKKDITVDVVSNPEFLREGSAIEDFMRPNRVVLGSDSAQALAVVKDIYRVLYLIEAPFVSTNLETAELIKYASNAFLATKISFINEVANICEKVGADVHDVARAMGLDKRIGPKFLHSGPGYGGSCFPKDTLAFADLGKTLGSPARIVEAVIAVNRNQRARMITKIENAIGPLDGKVVGVLGLTFKPNTSDVRESPALDIVQALLRKGAQIRAYDPAGMDEFQKVVNDEKISYWKNAYEAARGAEALVFLTEWNEFRNLDLKKLKEALAKPVVLDLRNIYEPERVTDLGFRYMGVGRGTAV